MFGTTELVLVLIVVVLLFGATRLPGLGKGLGEGIRGFRDAFKRDDTSDEIEKR